MPPVPATNSATTAPISARPDEMRSPPKKYGNALGMRKRISVCQRVARFILNSCCNPGFTLRKPSVVLEIIGKRATSVAQITSESVGSFTQMMTSGAMATIGVTCSSTAYGKNADSMRLFCTNKNATATPRIMAHRNAKNVILSVLYREPLSKSQSLTSVSSTSPGDGTK